MKERTKELLPDGREALATAEPIRRTLEIEDPTNLCFVHPVANRLVEPFARAGITPNAVSLAGMTFGIIAGVAYHFSQHVGFAVVGFALMIGWHVMDGVDGQLARLTRTHSAFGKVLDGICDYTTFGAVYIGLALTRGGWAWALVLVAGACHAVQSAIYELQRQDYNEWGHGIASAAIPAAALPPHRRGADLLLRVYLRVQRAAIDLDAREKLAAVFARRPERQAELRAAYREVFAPAVRRWSVMSANTRTLAIFLFAAIGRPMLYFPFEILGLGLVLAILLRARRGQYARFFTSPATRD